MENGDDGLNYDDLIFLDAEDLAEQGMLAAYKEVAPKLLDWGIKAVPMEELTDSTRPAYAVKCDGKLYSVYDERSDIAEMWNNATVAFFEIINSQLQPVDVRFYAINGGNDLAGMFLTEAQCERARRHLAKKDWPHLPKHGDYWTG